MTGIFKANNPLNAAILLLYGLLLKLPLFLHPVLPQNKQSDGFLFKFLLQGLATLGIATSITFSIITFFLLYAQALMFNNAVNRQRLFQKPNYLTGMCYLLMTSLFTEWNVFSTTLIINTILIGVWAKMCSLYSIQKPKTLLFNIGIAIGCCTFFYFPTIAFLALPLFGLVLLRPFNIAEWLVLLFGVFAPYYFYLAIIFLSDQWKNYSLPHFKVSLPKFNQTLWSYSIIIFIILVVTIGIFFIQKNFRRQLVQSRKSWNLIFLYTVIAIFIPFINATSSFSYWVLCAVPLSVLMAAAFFYPDKKWITSLLHWIIVGVVILVNYYV